MTIEVGDLYHVVSGRDVGHGRAIVFLHGLGSSSSDWALQTEAFETRYRVITLDLRGHGRSGRMEGRLTIEAMAEDVERLLARRDEGAAHVVGLSLGGCVAMALALQSPARVRSLTLINTFARLTPAGVRGALRMATRLSLLTVAPMPWVAARIARGLFPKTEQRALYQAAVASLSRTPRRTYLAVIRALLGFDLRRRLSGIRCPTLVVAGDRDATVPLAAKTAVARAIPGARLLVVPDSGHATPYDQPGLFNRVVLEFIASQEDGAVTRRGDPRP